ncbi:hypothetical protein T4B_6994 [Trichinella pseudospiralis]|uniref:Uncharacterized protein n=1 Tax=Trichinella pseudospiralis TaxID=6337 RepID=A0A0V1GPC1_TRIPS|nr:hypothetical protein T4B_6994 [Trichinella pseudospiralis]
MAKSLFSKFAKIMQSLWNNSRQKFALPKLVHWEVARQ